MVAFQKPSSLGERHVASYDPWNRLAKLRVGGQVTHYYYDGLGRRIGSAQFVDGGRERRSAFYYSTDWQLLEEWDRIRCQEPISVHTTL